MSEEYRCKKQRKIFFVVKQIAHIHCKFSTSHHASFYQWIHESRKYEKCRFLLFIMNATHIKLEIKSVSKSYFSSLEDRYVFHDIWNLMSYINRKTFWKITQFTFFSSLLQFCASRWCWKTIKTSKLVKKSSKAHKNYFENWHSIFVKIFKNDGFPIQKSWSIFVNMCHWWGFLRGSL